MSKQLSYKVAYRLGKQKMWEHTHNRAKKNQTFIDLYNQIQETQDVQERDKLIIKLGSFDSRADEFREVYDNGQEIKHSNRNYDLVSTRRKKTFRRGGVVNIPEFKGKGFYAIKVPDNATRNLDYSFYNELIARNFKLIWCVPSQTKDINWDDFDKDLIEKAVKKDKLHAKYNLTDEEEEIALQQFAKLKAQMRQTLTPQIVAVEPETELVLEGESE